MCDDYSSAAASIKDSDFPKPSNSNIRTGVWVDAHHTVGCWPFGLFHILNVPPVITGGLVPPVGLPITVGREVAVTPPVIHASILNPQRMTFK